MRVLLQRVSQGSVEVEGVCLGEIGAGLVVLVGIGPEDDASIAAKMAAKVANLRIFSDADDKFNLSLLDVGGSALVVSQFTLFADASRGRRPAFTGAARGEQASSLVDCFAAALRAEGVTKVAQGQFGASMKVALVNEGPVTIWLDSADLIR